MTAVATHIGTRLELGKVLRDVFGVVERNLVPFILAGLLLVGAPDVLGGLARLVFRSGVALSLAALAINLVSIVLLFVMQAGVFYATARDLNGSPAPPAEFVGVGRKAWLPLLGVSLLVGIGSALGMILLVVPGVLLLLRWSVAAAALVIEGRGVMDSMGRSAALTKGRRGTIFLLFLMIGVIILVSEMVLFGIVGGLAGMTAIARNGVTTASGAVLVLLVSPLLSIVFAVFGSVIGATLFHHLRVTREGGAPETLGQVFD
jgi:hypothetical protein